jgi:putative oxidoreductase
MTGNGTVSPTPPRPDRRRIVHLGCRWLLAAIFLMAALSKITDLAGFEEQVRLHADLPAVLEMIVIAGLPWIELTCGVCLALGYATREALLIAIVLLATFLGQSLRQFPERDCGCFLFPEIWPGPPAWWVPVRNAGLLVIGVVSWLTDRRAP